MKSITPKRCSSGVLLAAVLVAMPLRAQEEGCPPPRTLKKCGELGERYYQSAQYELAIQAFQQAYVINPIPLFLFNMAQAHRLAGRTDQAMRMYERYLQEDPKAEQKAQVEGYLGELRAKQEQERKVAELRKQQVPATRPIYKRWWFWTAFGVVAAGIVVGAVAGTHHSASADPAGIPIYEIH